MIDRIAGFLIILILTIELNHGLQAQESVRTHWNADPKADIFRLGTFDEPPGAKTIKGWKDLSALASGNATLGSGMLRLNLQPGDTEAFIETEMDVPEDAKYLTFKVRLRAPDLQKNVDLEAGAGVTFSLISKDTIRSLDLVEPSFGDYRNWVAPMQTMQVMPGENKLRIRAEVTKTTGPLEIDSILVIPSDISKEATVEQARELDEALAQDDPERIKRLVETAPHMLDVRTGGYDNGTPLIRTAWIGAPKVAEMLVKLGANLEGKDTNWGNTPLRWCCWWGVPEVAEILMEAGADATGAANMARSSKTNNRFTKRTPEDFDRTVKVIEESLAKRNAKK